MAGLENLLTLLAILAVGAILFVPVFLAVMMVKLMRRQEEAAQRSSAHFEDLLDDLREQKRLLRQILHREEPGPAQSRGPPPNRLRARLRRPRRKWSRRRRTNRRS